MLKPSLPSDQLRAAPWNLPVVDVTLDASILEQEQLCGELVWALAGLAPTLTALRGLPLQEINNIWPVGLTAFARLRALSLRQQLGELEELCAKMLPQSLTALRLEAPAPAPAELHPQLIAMGRLHHLQHITLVGHVACRLRHGHKEEEQTGPIPRSLEVRGLYPAAIFCMLFQKVTHLHETASIPLLTTLTSSVRIDTWFRKPS